ncbi:uncharacterized protein LOC129598260 [Paramacrobiotus metropolitanus]|uniref:uncharacterized protein LOC129598260 n=1 Tax=Paramacrobiotus metropolitanus TaxID=2943436 RepID=UPI0024461D5A|nr:uncharacterized protein LOC129598260 [Paramacrobiotus metropolitanus]
MEVGPNRLNTEVMTLLRDGWRPAVPKELSWDAKRVISACFRDEHERPSLEQLAADEFFRTAMSLESVVDGKEKPVFCMRHVTISQIRSAITDAPSGEDSCEAQEIALTFPDGARAACNLWVYRNLDADRPIAAEMLSIEGMNASVFAAACDLIVDLTISNVAGLKCDVFRELSLPNLLTLRLERCTKVVLAPGDLVNFSKLRCLEISNWTFERFEDNVLQELPYLEMLMLHEGNIADIPVILENLQISLPGLWQYLQIHPYLIQSRAAGDIWKYQSLISRRNSGLPPVRQPERCIQIGLHGEFRLIGDNIHKIIQTDELQTTPYKDELKELCKLQHPNLAAFSVTSSIHNLVLRMDYYAAGSVGDFFERRDVVPTLQNVTDLTRGILLGLQYLHSVDRSIAHALHGAIHPWNILLEPHGDFYTAKLSDMDNYLQKLHLPRSVRERRRTYSRYARWYMSPEMAECTAKADFSAVTCKTDIWSFGRVVTFILTQRAEVAKEQGIPTEHFDIKENALYPHDHRRGWFSLLSDAVPPSFLDLLYLIFYEDPENRPTADMLLRHIIYNSTGNIDSLTFRLVRTDRKPNLTAYIGPSSPLSDVVEDEQRAGSINYREVIREFTLAKSWAITSTEIGLTQRKSLEHYPTINHEAVMQFLTLDIQATEVLKLTATYFSDPGDIALPWHMDNAHLSWTEIRSYSLDILNGLNYLKENEIRSEPITIWSIHLCDQHSCGVYQKAKILITPSLLDLVGAQGRLDILCRHPPYWFAPEELTGFSHTFLPMTNIWHFGHILLEMAQVYTERYFVQENHVNLPATGEVPPSGAVKIGSTQSVLPFMEKGYKPYIPSYLSPKLREVLQQCFAEPINRPTVNELLAQSGPQSFFRCSDGIQRKIISHELPRFAMRALTINEVVEWQGALRYTEPQPHHMSATKIQMHVLPDAEKKGERVVFLATRDADRDRPMQLIVKSAADLKRVQFSPVSDLVIELLITGISGFDCRFL